MKIWHPPHSGHQKHFLWSFSDFNHFIISSGSKRQFSKSKILEESVLICRNARRFKIMKKSFSTNKCCGWEEWPIWGVVSMCCRTPCIDVTLLPHLQIITHKMYWCLAFKLIHNLNLSTWNWQPRTLWQVHTYKLCFHLCKLSMLKTTIFILFEQSVSMFIFIGSSLDNRLRKHSLQILHLVQFGNRRILGYSE
jgi:hypothetical protein